MRTIYFNTITRLLPIFFLLLPFPVLASWPIFSPPTFTFLWDNNLIDTASCPIGQGKIYAGLSLNMSEHFCRRFCPDTWEWIVNSDNQCHDLNEFNFQHYTFDYHWQGSGETETLYTVVTAYYGNAESNKSHISFTFTSEKNDHWQCSEMSKEYHTVICANDM